MPRRSEPTHSDPLLTQLRARRRELKLTSYALARRIGITHSYISVWEFGRQSPTVGNFIAWANALGLEVRLTPRAEGPKEQPCPATLSRNSTPAFTPPE